MSTNLQDNMKLYKIILIGSSSVGKTSLSQNIQDNVFQKEIPITIGVDFVALELNDFDEFKQLPMTYNIQLWDTAGHEKFSSITKAYYRNSNVILLCFDLSSRKSFNELHKWMEHINSMIDTQYYICLMGLKADKVSVISDDEITEFLHKYLITTFNRFSSKDEGNSKRIKKIILNSIKKYDILVEETEYIRELETSQFRLDNKIMTPLITTEDTRLDNIKYCC